jgi:hypothetical protein
MDAVEDRTIAYLLEQREAVADEDDLLFELEILDSPYATITKDFGVQVDDANSDLAPTPGGDDLEEFDADLILVVYSRVDGPDYSDRKAARTRAIALGKRLGQLFLTDPTMNSRVQDSRVLRCSRGWVNIKSVPYAIVNVPLIVNETGGRDVGT